MTPKARHAKAIGIPVKVMDEFDSAFFMICSVSHSLDTATILRLLSNKDMELVESMEYVYKYTNGDHHQIKLMYQESMFLYEMEQRGFYDEDKTADYVDKYIQYLHSI